MTALVSFLRKLVSILDSFAETTGRVVSWLTLFMVLTTFLVVVLRYAFNLGWIAMQESVTFMHGLVFLLAAAYTLKNDGHVRVDIFQEKYSERRRAWVELIGTVVLLIPVCLFILISSWDYVAASWFLMESSREAGGLPGVFILKTAIPLMAALMLLQGIAEIARNLLVLIDKRDTGYEAM